MKKIRVILLALLLLVSSIFVVYYVREVQPTSPTGDIANKQLIDQLRAENKAAFMEIDDLQSRWDQAKEKNKQMALEIKTLEASIEELRQETLQREIAYRTMVESNLVDILSLDSDIVVDLRYATKDNFMNYQAYPDNSRALLRRETAIKLIRACEIFKDDGYTLKIWDAYRPLSVQRIMWQHSPLPGYVADPDRGSNHNRGAAVDVTLLDEEGKELEMPSGFDDFTDKAARDYGNLTSEAKKNMDYMTQVMVNCGFKTIRTEWWHFDDVDSKNYPVLDVSLDH